MQKIKERIQRQNNYYALWVNGKTTRFAIDGSKPITELEYPEFYDVKITDKCYGNCPYCYMNSKEESNHAKDIVKKAISFFGKMSYNDRPLQIAVGGGEPTIHPDFIKFLKTIYNLNITPNYTTNGMFIEDDILTRKIMRATQKYCGGVAISCHSHLEKYWRKAADSYIENNIKLNFHIIISDIESINKFKELYEEYKDKVDYFVLLPYGVQGRAEHKNIEWDYLVKNLPEDISQIAFGANFYNYIIENNKDNTKRKITASLYEPELMSKFLDLKDMKLYPSSFDLKEIKEKPANIQEVLKCFLSQLYLKKE